MGLLYFNMPLDASSLRGRLNLLFNGLVFFCLMPYVSMSLYTADKKFYIADASAKLYRPHAYYAAKARGAHAPPRAGGRPPAADAHPPLPLGAARPPPAKRARARARSGTRPAPSLPHFPRPPPARAQVTATVPFQVLSALIFTFTVYGMAGLRPGVVHVVKNGVLAAQLYLIAVQARARAAPRPLLPPAPRPLPPAPPPRLPPPPPPHQLGARGATRRRPRPPRAAPRPAPAARCCTAARCSRPTRTRPSCSPSCGAPSSCCSPTSL